MAINGVVPARDRYLKDDVLVDYDPVRYKCSEDFAQSVVRGVLPIEYLDRSDRFRACNEPSHVQDVLLVEGFYPGGEDNDRRRKSARERVKKRRQRAH